MTANMFDDLILKARDICDTASKKTSELCEISRYKYECIRINGEIKKLYEQLGSSVYSMVKKKYENAELIASLTEEIDGQLARLREINQILAGLQRVAVCPVCGVKNDDENCFCAKCGARMKPETNPEPESNSEPAPAPESADLHYSEDIEG
ncbi:MAG: hypothetical protein HFE43_03240 [Oscillospiraceae bacterium]|jgi:hypothetical protein|nr:hypothetical protein [Oscillospiraceae bacterium]